MWWIILLAALGFTAYAVVTYYKTTDTALSTPKRVWAAVVLAAGAAAAWVAAAFNQGGIPQ